MFIETRADGLNAGCIADKQPARKTQVCNGVVSPLQFIVRVIFASPAPGSFFVPGELKEALDRKSPQAVTGDIVNTWSPASFTDIGGGPAGLKEECVMGLLKYIAGCFIPYTAVLLLRTRRGRIAARRKRSQMNALAATRQCGSTTPFDYEDAVDFLSGLGCNENHIRNGSMPLPSLDLCAEYLLKRKTDGPILGLHIGNFIGMSLAFLTDVARTIHPESLIVSIDPNVSHRGIAHPQNIVVKLLDRYKLDSNSIIIAGFSLERSENAPLGCDMQLGNLAKLTAASFDFCLLDGNHTGDYVNRELDAIHPLLKTGGLVFMDDVNENWPEIKDVFEQETHDYEKLEMNGRVGILRKIP